MTAALAVVLIDSYVLVVCLWGMVYALRMIRTSGRDLEIVRAADHDQVDDLIGLFYIRMERIRIVLLVAVMVVASLSLSLVGRLTMLGGLDGVVAPPAWIAAGALVVLSHGFLLQAYTSYWTRKRIDRLLAARVQTSAARDPLLERQRP